MNKINAQTIINEAMAAHAIAPTEWDMCDCGPRFITFKVAERGYQKVRNIKQNLERFINDVRKNAAAFGGGLIREEKARPAVSYASKTISLYKQLIEDQDWHAALQLAEEKLAPLFFFGTDGKSHVRVAPIPLGAEPRLVSCMNDDGKWTVIEPRTMVSLPSRYGKNARSRDAQVSDVLDVLNSHTDERREEWFQNVAKMETTDQSSARAQWMADHGIVDDAAIDARIEASAEIEAQAAQDVAEVVAQAAATVAIAEAMAPAAEDSQELVTCEAGESSTGSANGFTVAAMLASFTPTVLPSSGNAGDTTTPAVSSETPAPRPVESTEATAPAPEPVQAVQIDAGTPAMESTAEPVAHVVGTEAIDTALKFAMSRRFLPDARIDGFLTEADISTTSYGVVHGSSEFDNNTFIRIECVGVDNRNGYDIIKASNGKAYVIVTYLDEVTKERKCSWLRKHIKVNPAYYATRIAQTWGAQDTTPDDTQKFRVRAKSGEWRASFMMIGTMYALLFNGDGSKVTTTTYATHAERMQALESMARATTPPDTPPDGGLPLAAVDAPTEEPMAPVAECTPDTPSMETDGEFQKLKPFNMDPRKLLEHGVQAAQLIGLGVKYTGNISTPDGHGAITSVDDTRGDKCGSLRIDCTLEDGRVIHATPFYFTAELRPIMQFDGKMHGAPYLAELAMAATLAKSHRTSAEELRKAAHAQALIDLAAKYPQLKRADSTSYGGTFAAKNIRILLKEAFKGQKFSVTSNYSSINVKWEDGPTDAEVKAVIGRFDIGHSDLDTDYFYTKDTAFSQLFGGVQYLWTKRETSDALIQQAIDTLYADHTTKPTVNDWHTGANGCGWGDGTRRQIAQKLGTISAYKAPKAKA